jgi:hypothetical protein
VPRKLHLAEELRGGLVRKVCVMSVAYYVTYCLQICRVVTRSLIGCCTLRQHLHIMGLLEISKCK